MHLGHVHLLKNGIPLRRTAPIARTASRAVAPTDTTTRTPRAHAAIPAASCRFHSTSTGTTGAYASIRSWEASRAPPAPSDRPRSRSHSIKYKRPLRANVLGKPHILQTLRHLGHCSLAADAETDRRVVWKLREDFLRSAEAEDAFSAFVERSVPVGDEGGIAEEEIARSESERREVDMASNDDAYAAFLDKANQPAADATAQQQEGEGKKTFGTKSVDREVPHVLQQVEEYYVSDADEPFEGVSLGFGGGELSADSLQSLLGDSASSVSSQTVEDFDPRGQYKSVVDAVKKATGKNEVQVFRVELDGTRSEVWVVGVDESGDRIVGLKALVVES